MKNERCFLLMLCIFVVAGSVEVKAINATRNYKKLKLNMSTGITVPLGFLLTLEPKYVLTEQTDIGFKIEGATMVQEITVHGEGFTGEAFNAGTYQLTFDHYFSNFKFRPFTGFGIGLTSVEINNVSEETYLSVNTFGFMLRSGFENKMLRMAIEYTINGPTEGHPQNNYLAFKIGLLIGAKRITDS